ncbi:unnamed protein product [Staurois parvus]|uniref:Uncharacterized protein n=1 Tax=Staurois parvus TaxID=386267 RepID=A0ABN9A6D6_9NEOB|nr:unnamed protein product [Staurois parvus]
MGPPTDPGPSGSARVSKWSVLPCPRLSQAPVTAGIIMGTNSTHYVIKEGISLKRELTPDYNFPLTIL